jgi:hypothetical protein
MEIAQKLEERQVVCSACVQTAPESLIHVIPFFNASTGGFVTTYRCERCWLPSLLETETRLAGSEDAAEIASVATFFERQGIFMHEFRRGDASIAVRSVLLRMIDMLRSETIRLSIGSPLAVNDVHAAFVMKRNEQLAETAYEAMCNAHFAKTGQ